MKKVLLVIICVVSVWNQASAVDYSSCSSRPYFTGADDDTLPVFFYHYYDQYYDSTRVRLMIGELIHLGEDSAFFRINQYAADPFNTIISPSNEQEMADSSVSEEFMGRSGDLILLYKDLLVEKFGESATMDGEAIQFGVRDTVVFYLDILDSSNTVLQVLDTIGVVSFDNILSEDSSPVFIENGPFTENDTLFQKRYMLNIGPDAKTVRLRIRPHIGPTDGVDRWNMTRTSEIKPYQYTTKMLFSRERILEEIINAHELGCQDFLKSGQGSPDQTPIPNPYNIYVAPLPVNGMAEITIYNPARENIDLAQCWIVDMTGRLLRRVNLDDINSGISTLRMDFSEWNSGNYFVYFISDTRVLAKESFVIVH